MIASASVGQLTIQCSDQRRNDSRRWCDWSPRYNGVRQERASRTGRSLVCEMDFIDDRVISRGIAKAHKALANPIFVTPARLVVEHTVALAPANIETNVPAPI